jgi:hypothetical protein
MRTKRKLRPGDPGTKKYLKKYGKDLVCVRYRYDDENSIRYTTVELIIDSGPHKRRKIQDSIVSGNVYLDISPDEDALIEQVRLFGAVWSKQKNMWEMSYETADELNLLERIVK